MVHPGRVIPAAAGVSRTTTGILVGGTVLAIGAGAIGVVVWRRRIKRAELEAKVGEYLDAIFKAETDEERQKASVEMGGAMARGEFSSKDLKKIATAGMAKNIGGIAGSILGMFRMNQLRTRFTEEAKDQAGREKFAAKASVTPHIPPAPPAPWEV